MLFKIPNKACDSYALLRREAATDYVLYHVPLCLHLLLPPWAREFRGRGVGHSGIVRAYVGISPVYSCAFSVFSLPVCLFVPSSTNADVETQGSDHQVLWGSAT